MRYQSVAELALALVRYAPARARESVHRICGTMQAAGPSVNDGVPVSAPAGDTPGGDVATPPLVPCVWGDRSRLDRDGSRAAVGRGYDDDSFRRSLGGRRSDSSPGLRSPTRVPDHVTAEHSDAGE